MEVINIDPAVKMHLKGMQATSTPPVLPQLALEVMVNPPSPGDPSFELNTKVWGKSTFLEEVEIDLVDFCFDMEIIMNTSTFQNGIFRVAYVFWQQVTSVYLFFSQTKEVLHTLKTLSENAKHACDFLNSLPGMNCQPVMAGVFLYPCLQLPHEMIEEAKVRKLCRKMLYIYICICLQKSYRHYYDDMIKTRNISFISKIKLSYLTL